MSDEEKQLEESYAELTSEDRQQADLMKRLLETDGWKWLEEVMQGQLQLRRDFYELGSPDNAERGTQEFLRGEISMLRMVLQYPRDVLENARSAIAARESQLMASLAQLKGETND